MNHFLDIELRTLSVTQLQHEKQSTASQLLHVQQQISDLAYGNYRVYADAGSTTERCRKMFGEASGLVEDIEMEIQSVRESTKEFSFRSDEIAHELQCVKLAESKGSQLWDVLSLPTRMDVCIRAGYYDMAYSLTNYGAQLQTYGLTKNPVIKTVADKLVDARYQLLDELFNRFAGPIDLASSIQIVNNIRKIPYLSTTQLRIAILQYRDVYLEKQLLDIRSQPDFVLRMVEVYRDCMYDTMVLYLAVFPEGEMTKRDSSVDPRWDIWQTAGPSAVLSEWVVHNLNAMFSRIKNAGNETQVDVGALTSKLMSFAMSFGRMGVDFRPLIVEILDEFVIKRFWLRVQEAANKLRECRSIAIDGDVLDPPVLASTQTGAQPPAPPALAFWDDLCMYGNTLIDALNELRNGLSPVQLNTVLKELTNSMKMVVSWLCNMEKQVEKVVIEKAVNLFAKYLVPYINGCLLALFPYEKCCRPFYHTTYTLEQYEKRCAVQISELCKDSANSIVIEKLSKEADRLINGHSGFISIPTNGDAETNELHVGSNGNVPEQELSDGIPVAPDEEIILKEETQDSSADDNQRLEGQPAAK